MVIRRRFRNVAAALVAGSLTLGVAACANSGPAGSATSSSGQTAVSVSMPPGTPIKIGFGVAETGALSSSLTAAAPAARAWQDSVNAAGGIDGHPVEVVIADTKGDASAASAAMRQLVEQDGVSAVMISDPVTESSVAGYLASKHVPVIGAGGYAAQLWDQTPGFFALTPNSGAVTQSEAVAAAAAGAKRIGVIACVETATCVQDGPPIQQATRASGASYTGVVEVSATAATYTAQCLNFMQQQADAMVLVVDVNTSVRVMQNCIQQGYSGMFTSSSSSFNPALFKTIPNLKMVGTLNAFPWWVDAAPVQAFRTAMGKYAPGTSYASSSATAVWSALQLFGKVVKGISGDVTPASIMAGYYSVRNETLEGLLPQPITFTPGQPSPAVRCFWQFTYSSGDAEPKLLAPTGASGNGASGALATACLKTSA